MSHSPTPAFRFPMSRGPLLFAARGLGLREGQRVLDLCCGRGGASLLLAREFGVQVTGIDPSETQLEVARRSALELGLTERVQFRQMDPRHLELPAAEFDAVLALGGAPSVLGRTACLEQIGVHLVPGGWMLLADLVYLDSPPPAGVLELFKELRDEEGRPLRIASNRPGDIVRAVLEQGRFSFDTESGYRQLLEALGYHVELGILLPESDWAGYFARLAMEAGGRDAPQGDPDLRRDAAQEAAAYYVYGGRGTVGYLLIGARQADAVE